MDQRSEKHKMVMIQAPFTLIGVANKKILDEYIHV